MTKDELKKLKEKIYEEKEKNLKLKELLLEKEVLENDDKVKRYIELSNMNLDQARILSDDQIISSITEYRDFEDTNDIYAYMGSYKYNDNSDIIVNKDSSEVDYSLYTDIENRKIVKHVPIKSREEFEENNNIIYLNGIFRSDYSVEYLKVKDKFIKDILEYGEEKAISRVLKSNK